MPELRKTEIRWVKTLEKGSAWRLQTEGKGFSLVNFWKSASKWNNNYRNQQKAQQITFPSSFSVHWAGNTFLKWPLNGLVVARGHKNYCFGHVWLGLLFPLFFLEGLTGLFCKTVFLHSLPGEDWGLLLIVFLSEPLFLRISLNEKHINSCHIISTSN